MERPRSIRRRTAVAETLAIHRIEQIDGGVAQGDADCGSEETALLREALAFPRAAGRGASNLLRNHLAQRFACEQSPAGGPPQNPQSPQKDLIFLPRADIQKKNQRP